MIILCHILQGKQELGIVQLVEHLSLMLEPGFRYLSTKTVKKKFKQIKNICVHVNFGRRGCKKGKKEVIIHYVPKHL